MYTHKRDNLVIWIQTLRMTMMSPLKVVDRDFGSTTTHQVKVLAVEIQDIAKTQMVNHLQILVKAKVVVAVTRV